MSNLQHIRITVFPESPKTQVRQQDENMYDVFVTAPASEGRANRQAMKTLRDHLKVSGQMRIVSGHRSPKKVVEVIKGD